MRDPRARLALALDVPDLRAARGLIDATAEWAGVMKVGLQLFTAVGPDALRAVHHARCASFLDLKLHDIPATVAQAARAAATHGVRYLTVHAANGPRALTMAREAVDGSATQLLAVTALTSHDAQELATIGFGDPTPASVVSRLAALARDAGVHGFVCSPEEAALVRGLAPDAVIVTPGVRPIGTAAGDQKRVATPTQAIRDGADVLVVGRPIRDAEDPSAAAHAVFAEIEAASA